jgi:energy-coupling factor transport system permease protein
MTLFGDLTIGRYSPGDSCIHRLDPRAKLLACALALAGSFWSGSAFSALVCWPLLLAALWASGVSFRYFIRGFRPILGLLGLSVLLHAVTTPGRVFSTLPSLGLTCTEEGMALGLRTAAQLATAAGFASLLTLTTPPERLAFGLSRIFSPLGRLGLPVEEFFLSVVIALRFFPILGREFDAALEGRADRGRWKDFWEALVRRVLRRAEELTAEAEAAVPDNNLRSASFGAADWAALGASALTLAAVLALGGGAWA